MRCLGCKAWKDGKCLAGVVPYKSKKEADGVGCNCNTRTIDKKIREKESDKNGNVHFYSSTSVPIITNYDRVIRKTPEELVKHLACQWKECKNMDADCEKCLLDWLREEISE